MRKLILTLSAILVAIVGLQAQHVFDKGDMAINAGIGLVGSYGFYPSIEASFEMGVIPTGEVGLVSFGGEVGWKYSKYSWDYDWYDNYDFDYHFHQFIIGGRAAWHLHTFESDKYDVYGGVGIGLKIWTDKSYDYDYNHDKYIETVDSRSDVYGQVFVGGRMMLKDNFGIFAELGYGPISSIRAGVTLKL